MQYNQSERTYFLLEEPREHWALTALSLFGIAAFTVAILILL